MLIYTVPRSFYRFIALYVVCLQLDRQLVYQLQSNGSMHLQLLVFGPTLAQLCRCLALSSPRFQLDAITVCPV
jgi:hypothetical protein